MMGIRASSSAVLPLVDAWQPIALPRLSMASAQACTAIAQRVRHVEIDLGTRWEADLRPFPPGMRLDLSEHDGKAYLVRMRWESGTFRAVVPHAALHACLQSYLPEMRLPAVPDLLVEAAIEGVVACLQQSLGVMGASVSRIEGLVGGAPGAHDSALPVLLLEMRPSAGGSLLHVPLYADAPGLADLARHAARLPSVRNDLDLQEMPLTLQAVIGETWLDAAAMASLAVHDAILIDRYFLTEGNALLLRCGVEAGLWTVIEGSTLRSLGRWANDVPICKADAAGMRLIFEIGSITMPLRRLEHLVSTDDVVTVLPAVTSITIKGNGRVIGHGELVELEGRPAVALLGRPISH